MWEELREFIEELRLNEPDICYSPDYIIAAMQLIEHQHRLKQEPKEFPDGHFPAPYDIEAVFVPSTTGGHIDFDGKVWLKN